jgi:hypothetical protein
MAREVREGRTEGGLPYLSFGEGPLLVVFPGLGMTNANPSGIQRWGEMRLLAPLARTFTVCRRVGLAYGTTMEDLANDYAFALDEEFGGPVDVLGIPNARLIIYEDRAHGGTIASRLYLSPKTVRNYVSSIFTKLQVSDRSQAIVHAREAGLGTRGNTSR